MTTWDVVLGHTAGGELVIVPGPAGPIGPTGATGPEGPQGPEGPIAAPDATYFLDEADDDLENGIAIPRGLGPDRVPDSPNAMDDEMIDPTTGYNPDLWTVFNAGSETYSLDPVGGLKIESTDDDEVLHGIEQTLPDSGPFAFTAKLTNSSPTPGTTGGRQYIGIYFRNITTGRWDLLYHAKRSQVNQVIRTKANADSSFVSDTFSTWPDPSAFYYLRMSGDGSGMAFEISTNGINFVTLETTALYCGTPNRIGIFVFGNEGIDWSGFVQWFRRTA